MFLRGNLAVHGLNDGDSPRALSLALRRNGAGIAGVFGISNAGFALMQAPDATPGDWAAYARWMQDRPLMGLTGDSAQVAAASAALALDPQEFLRAEDEPLYRLDLTALRLDGLAPGTLRLPEYEHRDLLIDWYSDFEISVLGTPPDLARETAALRADFAITEDRVKLLIQDGIPVAMTAFNARLPEIVQVGGVYTPPALRNRHAARTAVALHLQEAREDGVRIAVLAAANPAAARAYEALGFARIGRYTLALLKTPREGRTGGRHG
jgi:Predicted acetyltransferase